MRQWIFGIALTSVLASGEEALPVQNLKLDANRAKALNNALRAPLGSTADNQNFAARFGVPSRPSATSYLALPQEARITPQETCAIPLQTVRGDENVDPRIEHKLKGGDAAIDNMPGPVVMPVCAR